MKALAKVFVLHVRGIHGDSWVLLFCNNLSAHVDSEVKQIFLDGKVFICYLPSQTTESTQPIDGGIVVRFDAPWGTF